MGLTPFQITFGTPPPPIIPSLQSEPLAGLDDQDMLDSIWWLQWTYKHIWHKLRALYESVAPPPNLQVPAGRLDRHLVSLVGVPRAAMRGTLCHLDYSHNPKGGWSGSLGPLFTCMPPQSHLPAKRTTKEITGKLCNTPPIPWRSGSNIIPDPVNGHADSPCACWREQLPLTIQTDLDSFGQRVIRESILGYLHGSIDHLVDWPAFLLLRSAPCL